ncbi:MAG: phosphoglycerate kinase [Lachnospiraceae bacterium]|nr:phosphoglycerate kinase [Lachnospiraceae bacterium]
MLNKKSVDDINVKGLRVLVRCDFNVPLKDGKITDENRLVAALPTLKKLINDGGKIILCSHLGKPEPNFEKWVKKQTEKGKDPATLTQAKWEKTMADLTLAPVAARLSELLGQEVKFAADAAVVGENAKAAVAAMEDGDVILLENTRFRAEETKNVDAFSQDLASLCDVFVNDAFGTAHRAHCSNVGVTKYVDTAVVGYLMQKEIDFLGNAVDNPTRPFAAVLGGAKVSSKISVINNLLDKVDILVIGGGMAYTFEKAFGGEIGNSLCEDDYLDYAKEMVEKAAQKGVKLYLPIDHLCGDDFSNDCNKCIADAGKVPAGFEGMDIGPKSIEAFTEALKTAKTVVWNGPMGCFEMSNFAPGTEAICQVLAGLEGAVTIIGGGDSAAAVNQMGYGDKMTHISTGGGASLEFLEGKELPGVAAANDK